MVDENAPGYVQSLDTAAAIGSLYRAEAASLLGMLTVYTGERAVAEDLVQEAYLRLQRAWDRLEGPGSASHYVRVTAFNLARSRFRRLRVARSHSSDEPDRDSPSAEDGLMLREDQREVIEAVRRLSPRQRACIVLRYYGGLSEREIAETLRVSPSSVKTHTRRAMEVLERMLEVKE